MTEYKYPFGKSISVTKETTELTPKTFFKIGSGNM